MFLSEIKSFCFFLAVLAFVCRPEVSHSPAAAAVGLGPSGTPSFSSCVLPPISPEFPWSLFQKKGKTLRNYYCSAQKLLGIFLESLLPFPVSLPNVLHLRLWPCCNSTSGVPSNSLRPLGVGYFVMLQHKTCPACGEQRVSSGTQNSSPHQQGFGAAGRGQNPRPREGAPCPARPQTPSPPWGARRRGAAGGGRPGRVSRGNGKPRPRFPGVPAAGRHPGGSV